MNANYELIQYGQEVAIRFTLPCDPSKISTAQQKQIHFKTRCVFTNKKVAAGMKLITLLAVPYRSLVRRIVPHGTPIAVTTTFLYAYPKGTAKSRLLDCAPMPTGADCDNRYKSVGDALTHAGWWDDDREVTSLTIRKRRTTGSPRIIVEVRPDDGRLI